MLLLKKADEIRKELHKIENTKKPTKTQKERYYRYLIELMNVLDKKEKYKHSDYNDLNYFGIRDIENLFISADDDYILNQHWLKALSKVIMNIMKSEVI